MWPLITLRARSAGRVAAEVARREPLALTAVLAVVALGAWRALGALHTGAGSLMVAALACAPAWLAHLGRDDERLLRDAGLPVTGTRAAEYLLLGVPGAALLLAARWPWLALVPFLVAVPLAGTRPAWWRGGLPWRRPRRAWRVPLVPAAAFEAVSGVRRRGAVIALLWLLAVPLSRVPAAAVVLVLIVALATAELQGDGEGREMVRAARCTAPAFLRARLVRAVAMFVGAALPIVLLVLAREPERWGVAALALWVGSAAQAGAVLHRYAFHAEGRRTSVLDTLSTLAAAACALLPPALPLVLLPLWRRAVRRLQPHLGAAAVAAPAESLA